MEGRFMGSKRRRSTEAAADGEEEEEEYYIRPLSAPMHLSRTGELCSLLHISQGTVLSIGRSRKWCDLVFEDSRVSRKHCRIQLLSNCNELILSHGSYDKKDVDGDPLSGSSYKPSLNGIFVNGHELNRRSMTLKCGDEVSLVGPTQAGKCLELDCQLAVGFIVETRKQVSSTSMRKKGSDPTQLISQIDMKDDKLSYCKRVSVSPTCLSSNGRLPLEDCYADNIDDSRQKQPFHNYLVKTKMKWFHVVDSTVSESVDESRCLDRNTEEEKSKLKPLNALNYNKESLVVEHSNDTNGDFSGKNGRHLNIIHCTPNERTISLDLDNKLLSAFNLVKASIELRNTLLNESKCYPFVDQEKPMLSVEKNEYYTSIEDMQSQILLENKNYDKFVACEENACINPEKTVIENSYLNLVQVDNGSPEKIELASKGTCSTRKNTTDNVCLWKIGNEFTCHVANYATKCLINQGKEELEEDSRVEEDKVSYRMTDKESLTEDHDRTDDTQLIEKNRMSIPKIKVEKDYTSEVKPAYPVMSSETAILHFGDEHYLNKSRDVSYRAATLSERNTNILLKHCARKGNDQEERGQFTEALTPDASYDKASKLRCLYGESHHALEVPQQNGFCNGKTSLKERTSILSRDFSIKDIDRVSEKDPTPELKVVDPEITSACDHKGSSQTIADEWTGKEETYLSNTEDPESKSGSSIIRKHCTNTCDIVVEGYCSSRYSGDAAYAESNTKVDPHGCATDIHNLQCAESEEQCKKKEIDKPELHAKHTQEEGKKYYTLEKYEYFQEEDNQNVKMNSQIEERYEGTSAGVLAPDTDSFGYFLNQLKDIPDGHCNTVSLQSLFMPIDSVQALFITTFTYDVEWFLSFSGISSDIPITVTCHNAQRCFSTAIEDRCEKPYVDWPNVTLVYPSFPKTSSIGKGRGIGCYHPKVFLQFRTDSIRVVVSSANLSFKQWFHVTNNVWWQDFPRREIPDFRSLFRQELSTMTDFASQLASFLANILENVPSEAHWITDLAAFDFSLATGSLVASIPGIHNRMYENAPQFLQTLEKDSFSHSQHEINYSQKHLGIVVSTVAGVKYRFCSTADHNGLRIRSLAAVLNDVCMYNGSTMPVLLKRAKYLKADPNAVSVVVTSQALCSSQDLFLQEDLHNADINTLESLAIQNEQQFIKLGFLPRNIANWLALLCDKGFFSFAACIWPSEALAVASGQSDAPVKLALYVFQGPKFTTLATTNLTNEELAAFGGLLKSMHNTWGMWRLEHLLSKYNWIDSHESDFFVASSSLGTSLDAKFLAAFAAASGQRADSLMCSPDSDPEWGCWTAEHEAMNPSIGIVFPTIDRVKQKLSDYGILCFAESAWLRLKSARLLYDAVPYPPEREGFPMHIKVARRRFQESPTSRPYGWLYCGSHNFSPAAWGRPAWKVGDSGNVLGSSLQISNYEIGIVFVEPPPSQYLAKDEHEHGNRLGIDRFIMPFKMPPPIYTDSDRPATGRAITDAYVELRALQLKAAEEMDAAAPVLKDEIPEEVEVCNLQQQEEVARSSEVEDAKAEEFYVEALWSQIEDENENG